MYSLEVIAYIYVSIAILNIIFYSLFYQPKKEKENWSWNVEIFQIVHKKKKLSPFAKVDKAVE